MNTENQIAEAFSGYRAGLFGSIHTQNTKTQRISWGLEVYLRVSNSERHTDKLHLVYFPTK